MDSSTDVPNAVQDSPLTLVSALLEPSSRRRTGECIFAAHILGQWKAEDPARWKISAFQSVVSHAPFGGKRSTPWGQGTVHDFMHAKVTVADDVAFVGSYNLSHAGEQNAENMLEIHDGGLADRLTAFIDGLRARYPR